MHHIGQFSDASPSYNNGPGIGQQNQNANNQNTGGLNSVGNLKGGGPKVGGGNVQQPMNSSSPDHHLSSNYANYLNNYNNRPGIDSQWTQYTPNQAAPSGWGGGMGFPGSTNPSSGLSAGGAPSQNFSPQLMNNGSAQSQQSLTQQNQQQQHHQQQQASQPHLNNRSGNNNGYHGSAFSGRSGNGASGGLNGQGNGW